MNEIFMITGNRHKCKFPSMVDKCILCLYEGTLFISEVSLHNIFKSKLLNNSLKDNY